MNRRRREIAAAGRDAENAAYGAYRDAIRSGQDLGLKTANDVRNFGAKLGDATASAQRRVARGRSLAADAAESLRQGGARATRRLAEDPSVRRIAGDTARFVGRPAGAVRGAVHSVEDVANAVALTASLVTPDGRRQLGEAAKGAADYVHDGLANPRKVGEDISDGLRRFTQDVDPRATPQAPRLRDEIRRNFDIGMNQGELGFDVASTLYGGAELKGIRFAGKLTRAEHVANYVAQGVSPKLAEYLAEPYAGRGHHIVRQSTRLPEILGGGRLPQRILENPFNKVSGRGMTRGEFAALHYGVDRFLHGGRVAKRAGARGWSGKALGFERYGPVERAWAGTSPTTKGSAALGLGVAGTADEVWDGHFEQ